MTDADLLRMKSVIDRVPGKSRWGHVKTGGLYQVLGTCMMEATWSPGILYVLCEPEDATLHPIIARDAEEFLDGRFERVD